MNVEKSYEELDQKSSTQPHTRAVSRKRPLPSYAQLGGLDCSDLQTFLPCNTKIVDLYGKILNTEA